MSLAGRLSRLVPDLSETLARFPIPALISVLVFVYAQLEIAESVSDGFTAGNYVYLGAAAAFLASGAAHYFGLSRNMPRLVEIIMATAAALIAGGLAYWDASTGTSHMFLFAGLVPLLMIAGFLRKDAKQGALWLFNLRLGIAILLATVVGVIFAGGVSAIIESLKFLFNVELPWRTNEHVWAMAAALISPIYGLALAPTRLDEEVTLVQTRDTMIERGVSVLVNYVVVPIAVIYTLILHAYAVKILLNGVLPEGQIGIMVTIFALGGTASWLVAWPWRDTGTWLLRFFMRFWFWFTIVPAILLVVATWERISTYGVTPERYGIAIVAIWLALVTLYLAIRRNRADMRVLLASFAILVLIGSAGPWGANSVSIESQFARLEGFLASEKLLTPEGKIADPVPKLSDQGKREIYAILLALNQMGGLDKVKPYFIGRKDDPFVTGDEGWTIVSKISDMLKLTEYTPPPDQVNFNANKPANVGFTGPGRLIGPLSAYQVKPGTNLPPPSAWIEGDLLVVDDGTRRVTTPVKPLMEKVKAIPPSETQSPVTYEVEPGVQLILTGVYGTLGDKPSLNTVLFWVILPP